MDGVERWHCVAVGRVQGVGYRARVSESARKHGLCGSVANRPDGSVHIDVQGPLEEIEAFLGEIAGSGGRSHAAAVRKVAVFPADPGAVGFAVL